MFSDQQEARRRQAPPACARAAASKPGRRRRAPRLAMVLLAVLLTALPGAAAFALHATDPDGEALYRRGQTASGQPLRGRGDASTPLEGAELACANCHRRSGLGSVANRSAAPPISGRFLFASPTQRDTEGGLPYVDGNRRNRPPYSDASFARALRSGIDAAGRTLSPRMPRLDIDDHEVAALLNYLKELDHAKPVGISNTELELATIVTPDADPRARAGTLAVLSQFVADINSVHFATTASIQPSARTDIAKSMFRAHRKWNLHVWQLEGPADTWQGQLERRLAAEPVFAVLSGVGGANWAPVAEFCEKAELPCLFPNVEAPPRGDAHAYYTTYFSPGVLLEADLVAEAVKAQVQLKPDLRLRQVYRVGSVGETAARALEQDLAGLPVSLSRDALPAYGALERLPVDDKRVAPADVLVLWLRPPDLQALTRGPPPEVAAVYVSGLIGGLEHAPLAPAWRPVAHLIEPVDLPERRLVRVDFAMGWFALRHVPVLAPRIQADTYLACGLLSEVLNESADVANRDYLLEKLDETVEHRLLTGYYPKLSLAPGQRFASKSGLVVRFARPEGAAVIPEASWTQP